MMPGRKGNEALHVDATVASAGLLMPCRKSPFMFVFARLGETDGVAGFGEASHQRSPDAAEVCIKALSSRITGKPLSRMLPELHCSLVEDGSRAMAVATSAFAQAFWDLLGKLSGLPVWMLLGGAHHERVPCYANINRAVGDRSIQAWQEKAAMAVSRGFRSIKIAPFDGVESCVEPCFDANVERGIQVVAAVREAIPAGIRLLVDCHWRFNPVTARRMIDRLAEHDVAWIEGAIPEKPDLFPELRKLRSHANARNMMLAGGEYLDGHREHHLALEAGVFDAINPDVRYCGGPPELLRLGHAAAETGVMFAPHNPEGPVMDAASAHVCHAAPAAVLLERRFGDSSWQGPDPATMHTMEPRPDSTLPDAPGWGVSPAPQLKPTRSERSGKAETA